MPRKPPTTTNVYLLNKAARAADGSGFRPTQEQELFRTVAQRCVEAGEVSAMTWCTRFAEMYGSVVTTRMFSKWCEDAAFSEWFESVMPQAMTPVERRLTEALAQRALAQKAVLGDTNAVTTLSRMDGSAGASRKKPGRGAVGKGHAQVDADAQQTREAVLREMAGGKP